MKSLALEASTVEQTCFGENERAGAD